MDLNFDGGCSTCAESHNAYEKNIDQAAVSGHNDNGERREKDAPWRNKMWRNEARAQELRGNKKYREAAKGRVRTSCVLGQLDKGFCVGFSLRTVNRNHKHFWLQVLRTPSTTIVIIISSSTVHACSWKRNKRSRRQLVPALDDATRQARPQILQPERAHTPQHALVLPTHVCL